MNNEEAATAAGIAQAANKATMIGSSATVIFGLSLNEWGVVVGIITALAGLAVNFYYRRKEYRLMEARHKTNPVQDHR
jgi:Bacteriophage holin family HP1